ncbi:endolytic transglycosylase MltG [Acinetobacter sp. S40]|uniref:endolytic transglycosylase MltG n=1 Tax=Acinetobacter sp. S40 TaxID=2767434 RepID=UPI00190DAF22|nr:endolytic transglycosylase MltG [Acinetobacter sp. S40]MBJ9986870.1 endolytic transglycosylase MltG [Acinetobacter sp. S40]
MSKPSNKPKAKNKKKPPNKIGFFKKNRKWLMALCILGIGVVSLVWTNLFKDYPVKGKKELLVVASGDTYSHFIERLARDNQVSIPLILKIYQKFFIHDTMKAGVYEVPQGMSIRQVLGMLSNAENAQMIRVQVIEGTTFKQLIANLKKDPYVTKSVVNLPQEQIAKELGLPYSHPEGLFAPNTYFFSKGETDKKILSDLYQHQMKALDTAWQNRAADLPYKNKYEALIMASIIEKETSLDRELEQVSGVFVRRLKLGMRLQTDPTVIYGMGDNYQGKISRQDLRTPTPYNTYTMSGLPPTPIAMPGKKAIEAAMHPDQSDTIYFVATGNGGHKFSATLQAHNQAVQDYLSVLRSKN